MMDNLGCVNLRDLGALPTHDGRRTLPGAVLRGGSVNGLAAAGWATLVAAGVRTRVLTAVAEAEPGGVLLHCQSGRDRTGQISMLLLAVVGVEPKAIARDYARSTAPDSWVLKAFLAEHGSSPREALLSALDGLDVARDLGLPDTTIRALRDRLLGPA